MNTLALREKIAEVEIEYKAAQVQLSLARAQLDEAYRNEALVYESLRSLNFTLASEESRTR